MENKCMIGDMTDKQLKLSSSKSTDMYEMMIKFVFLKLDHVLQFIFSFKRKHKPATRGTDVRPMCPHLTL